MEKHLLENAKKQLIAEQKRLRAELLSIASKKEHGVDQFETTKPEYGTDADENAEEVTDYGDRISVERDLQDSLASVDAALAAMKAGTYGMCSVCKKKISPERIEAIPEAMTCAEHAAEHGT